jgi:small subunit ribosomal protein S4
MGDPRKLRKRYTPPKRPWDAERLKEEKGIVNSFGLRNKKEIWRTAAAVRKFRYRARGLVGIPSDKRKGEEDRLLSKLQKMGLLKEGATLDDALSLKTEDLLSRRLQTLVWRNGLAGTLSQARQLITHGHISVSKRRVNSPGMTISTDEESTIEWYGKPVEIIRKAGVPEPQKEEPKTEKKEEKKEKPKTDKKPRKKPVKKKAEGKPEEIKEVETNEG